MASESTNIVTEKLDAGLGVVRTSSGRYLDIRNPNIDDICIEDIAHSLSMQARFNGHLSTFVSVAEHSIMVAATVQKAGHKGKTLVEALLHDATEAYLCDIPSPIKPLITGYKELERNLARAIGKKFDIELCDLHPAIKDADFESLVYEWDCFMIHVRKHDRFPMSQDTAKTSFLMLFDYYRNVLK